MVTVKVIVFLLVFIASVFVFTDGIQNQFHILSVVLGRSSIDQNGSQENPLSPSRSNAVVLETPTDSMIESRSFDQAQIRSKKRFPQRSLKKTSVYTLDKVLMRDRRGSSQLWDCTNIPLDVTDHEIIKKCHNVDTIGGLRTLNLDWTNFGLLLLDKKSVSARLLLENSSKETLKANLKYCYYLTVNSNNNLRTLDFELESAGLLYITNNRHLEKVHVGLLKYLSGVVITNNGNEVEDMKITFNSLEFAYTMLIENNSAVKQFELPVFKGNAMDKVSIVLNKRLMSVNFPKMEKVKVIKVFENDALENVNFQELTEIGSLFQLRNQPVLELLEMPKLQSLPTDLDITSNDKLRAVVIGNEHTHLNLTSAKNITIARNPSLKKIDGARISDLSKMHNVQIYGNKNLLRSDISLTNCPSNAKFECYIQEDYECIVELPVSDLSSLDGCRTIYGDLPFASIVNGSTTSNLTIIHKNMRIDNNAFEMESLPFLAAVHIKGHFSLNLSSNLNLVKVIVRKVGEIRDDFIVEKNAVLEEVKILEVGGIKSSQVNISYNPLLKHVVVGMDTELEVNVDSLSIVENPNLKRVVFGNLKNTKGFNNISIYGNRRLSRSDIVLPPCPEEADCYIQEDYECIVEVPISNISVLDECESIYNDLVLNESVFGNTTAKIKVIQGNLRIVNASLNITDLLFLENVTIKGDIFITSSCATMAEIAHLNITYRNISFVNSTCSGNCTPDELWVFKQPNCETIVGDLQIAWDFYSGVDVRNFKSIKRVIGSIFINNINPYPWDTPPLIFDNLEEIITEGDGWSVELWSLTYTTEFILPKLRSVKSRYKKFMDLKSNSFLTDPDESVRLQAKIKGWAVEPNDLETGNLVTQFITIDEESLNPYEEKAAPLVQLAIPSGLLIIFLEVLI